MEIEVKEIKDITFHPEIGLTDTRERGAMSMAVIKAGGMIEDYYQALYRHLYQPKTDQPVLESVLAFASSQNGTDFTRSGVFPVEPTRESGNWDQLAVEDPTIVKVDNVYYVFHTAVRSKSGGEGVETAIQLATGKSLKELGNKTLILTPKDAARSLREEKGDMVKEPEFFQQKDGKWLMIYEFANGQTSRIAVATGQKLEGPYTDHRILFDPREGKWDSQHTSPGPIITTPQGDLCIFYNGRGPRNDVDQTPTWAIGYAIIDGSTGEIKVRADKPIIIPPINIEVGPGGQLIAFANSIVEGNNEKTQTLFYTLADQHSARADLLVNL